MTGADGIAALGAISDAPVTLRLGDAAGAPIAPYHAPGFGEILLRGLQNVDAKIATADQLVQQFAIDGSVPVHQVTIALEQARLAVELAMQVRARMLEGYREIMNMSL
ncbi:flagellar hook-basal body complex protein FliE [Sphingomonas elodea]|uniref:flagellar hook-basal body complex protein FliE n=1 Tax=Sphingomonas elodea TaxID=179878 RepID=UPI0002631383|nr:flagellar hook-basal body complex protein FliE [Sphingomonas elodea]